MLYSGDLNTYNLNTELFEVQISNGLVFKWFGIQMVSLSAMSYLLRKLLHYLPKITLHIRKQDGIHL